MSSKLYTAEILALATSLAAYPAIDGAALAGEARSRSCGSSLRVGLMLDDAGRISQVGLKTQACAVGQAAAAVFAAGAAGRSKADIIDALDQIDRWIADGAAPLPDWPGFAALAAARAYPARHGAMRLAWLAAIDALRDQP